MRRRRVTCELTMHFGAEYGATSPDELSMAARSVRPVASARPGIDRYRADALRILCWYALSLSVQPVRGRPGRDSGSETAHGARTGASGVSEFMMLNAFMPVLPSNRE